MHAPLMHLIIYYLDVIIVILEKCLIYGCKLSANNVLMIQNNV